jgi:hypothetical protein
MIIPDVSFVLAFAGSTLGNGLIYIYPALMFRGASKKLPNPTKLQKAEVKIALSAAIVGLGMGILGAIKAGQQAADGGTRTVACRSGPELIFSCGRKGHKAPRRAK